MSENIENRIFTRGFTVTEWKAIRKAIWHANYSGVWPDEVDPGAIRDNIMRGIDNEQMHADRDAAERTKKRSK